MSTNAWEKYPLTYRAREMRLIAQWIMAGDSGAVVGLKGCGRSHLLGFLCHRQDALKHYLPGYARQVVLIPVDIYNLPATDLSTLYRVILHAFYWLRERFDPELQQAITGLYLENRVHQDPFLPQMALYDLLQLLQNQQIRIVLVLNRFDRFCETATPQMMNTLRGLRDTFRETLCYLAGMLKEVAYLPDPVALGDLYELLVGHVCWVGAMSEMDGRQMLEREFEVAANPPGPAEITAMLRLSGCFPSLLKAIAQWWLLQSDGAPPLTGWTALLAQKYTIQFRLNRIWTGLTQAEQLALSSLQEQQLRLQQTRRSDKKESLTAQMKKVNSEFVQQHQDALHRLTRKGLCRRTDAGWWISSDLMAAYVAEVGSRARGGIRLDEAQRVVYQGRQLIEDLTPLQYEILRFFIQRPRVKHSRDDVIDNAWPEEEQREGITPNALQVHIRNIRKKIEPDPAEPCYLITWHGRPGGYQFFPEGKPL